MSPARFESSAGFRDDEAHARELDAADRLAGFRRRFRLPRGDDGSPKVYLCGNSLGLQPVDVEDRLREELDDWGRLAVDAHFEGRRPWYGYHERFRESGARLVGARPGEVVMMNGLTTNLHLMMVSFYRPTASRNKILIEDCAFPSDTYAVRTQLRFHGHDPEHGLLVARPRAGEHTLREEDLETLLDERGQEIALVLLGGVNYYTGQAFDMQRVAAAARGKGCRVGLDLAHAAGNLELRLHDWDVDFAVWCSYKYLNAGPGAVAGCFVHERHGSGRDLPRFAGWWGNDPSRRFLMHLEPEFRPVEGAEGWQLSNPPILALAPLEVARELFEAATMPALREKSERLTAYLLAWIDHVSGGRIEVLTPREPSRRGCQISMRVSDRSRELFDALTQAGVVVDYREPDAVRIAPVPLYNSFHDVWRFGQLLRHWCARYP
jgi:kynureninase